MPAKTRRKTEFGDFQTPPALAHGVCDLLVRLGLSPGSIVEPTCGRGSFLLASENTFRNCEVMLGYEVNSEYVRVAQSTVEKAVVHRADFFTKDWPETFTALPEPILVVGNPPWVTNSAVGAINGTNLPAKSNFQGFTGFDAITGKSNFDISEWMLMHLLAWLSGRAAVLAMLCKTIVARKVLHHSWNSNLQIRKSATYAIDALDHFGAAVDACLLVCTLEPGFNSKKCDVYACLEASEPESTFAIRGDRLVADLDSYDAFGHYYGTSPLKWRSGIKHDCSRVMELRMAQGTDMYINGLGEIVKLESDFLYPMLKSSELMKGDTPSRYMVVTQRTVGEDTTEISNRAPFTWHYLESHAENLDSRASSIYRNRPRFSVFGIGKYSFAPWKVAISGFYKRLDFLCVGPIGGKPVVLDDTCYFLPCQSQDEARELASLLNSEKARGFFKSFIFWDAKRPITAGLLSSLDLSLLAADSTPRRWRDFPVQHELTLDNPILEEATPVCGMASAPGRLIAR